MVLGWTCSSMSGGFGVLQNLGVDEVLQVCSGLTIGVCLGTLRGRALHLPDLLGQLL